MLSSWVLFYDQIDQRLACGNASSLIAMSRLVESLAKGFQSPILEASMMRVTARGFSSPLFYPFVCSGRAVCAGDYRGSPARRRHGRWSEGDYYRQSPSNRERD